MQVYFLFEYYSKGDLETSYPLIVGRFRKLPRATGHTIVPFERMNKLDQKKRQNPKSKYAKPQLFENVPQNIRFSEKNP